MKPSYHIIIAALLFLFLVCMVAHSVNKERTEIVEPFHRMLRPYIRKTRCHIENNHSLAKEYISRGYRKLTSFSIY